MTDRHEVFAYLNTPNADLYRQIMIAFMAAKRRFIVHLRPEDLYGVLAPSSSCSLPEVAAALGMLEGWGNLRSDPDTSRVTTVEDFRRARFLFQLTEQGEAAEHALEAYDQVLGRRGALQAVALEDIVDLLRALRKLAADPEPDPAKVHLALGSLVGRFTDLADNAQAFMGSLQRSIDLQDVDLDAFRAYKDRLIEYLERFIADLVTTGSEIARVIEELETGDVVLLLDLAARRESQDAAPGEGPAGEDPREQEFHAAGSRWRERWLGFRGWFVGSTEHPSQARLLRGQARAAIPQLLQVVAALNERRAGRSDRSADFRTLALWFAQAPGDDARHRLWRAAFGLNSARHLSVDADTMSARDDSPVPGSTSWRDAPPLEISPRLRRTGSYERRGKPHQVIDRSAQRRHLRELAEREAREVAAARRALARPQPLRLSDFGVLDPQSFRLLLGLLGDALAARRPGADSVTTTTSDGALRIVMSGFDGTARATIRTVEGTFSGPDALVRIDDLGAVVDQDGAQPDQDDAWAEEVSA